MGVPPTTSDQFQETAAEINRVVWQKATSLQIYNIHIQIPRHHLRVNCYWGAWARGVGCSTALVYSPRTRKAYMIKVTRFQILTAVLLKIKVVEC